MISKSEGYKALKVKVWAQVSIGLSILANRGRRELKNSGSSLEHVPFLSGATRACRIHPIFFFTLKYTENTGINIQLFWHPYHYSGWDNDVTFVRTSILIGSSHKAPKTVLHQRWIRSLVLRFLFNYLFIYLFIYLMYLFTYFFFILLRQVQHE